MQKPVVSIISPTYRHAAVIAQCIESVRAQTYACWEQIIVDDGSDDTTAAIAQRYAQQDSRIRVIIQAHKGIERLHETYNEALAQSSGEFIAILEGDDYWPSDKLETQVALHQADRTLVLSHGITLIDTKGAVTGTFNGPPGERTQSCADYLRWTLLRRAKIVPATVMIRRSALLTIGGFRQTHAFPAVDYTTWLELFRLSGKVTFLDYPLGYWRNGTVQVTKTHGVVIAEEALKAALDAWNELSEPIRQSLQLTPEEIFRSHFRHTMSDCYLGGLRTALQTGDRALARHCIRQLVRNGETKRKIQALVGIAMLGLHADMEWIFAAGNHFMVRR